MNDQKGAVRLDRSGWPILGNAGFLSAFPGLEAAWFFCFRGSLCAPRAPPAWARFAPLISSKECPPATQRTEAGP